MLKFITKNHIISVSIHIFIILISGLSVLWANASTIEEPIPIKINFIGTEASQKKVSEKKTPAKERTVSKKQPPTTAKTPKPTKRVETKKAIKKPVPKKVVSEKPKPVKKEKVQEKTITKSQNSKDKKVSKVNEASSSSSKSMSPKVTKAGIAYEKALLKLLSNAKKYPRRAQRRGLTGDGLLSLKLNRDGSIKKIRIINSTSSRILDKELEQMVHRASPLPPIPDSYSKSEFIIPVRFALGR